MIDACRYGWRKHSIHGLLEVDVTEPRRRIRERAERGEGRLSFTGFVVRCVAVAVAEDPILHAYRDWRRRLVVFDDVDVDVIIERLVSGARMGTRHIVRGANRRSVEEIHEDLRSAQRREFRLRDHPGWAAYLYLPGFVRNALWRIGSRFPKRVKRHAGTVSVTAIGMFGEGGGWGIGLGGHTLGVAIGGIGEKPVAVDGEVEIREVVSLTLSFDHDIVDGAPATRFAKRLKEKIEHGEGIEARP
ncbi:MAG: 2-oxo acid dehydrogenase subunit E2 [Gemmatimonadota bacterium]|nr:2-oxo acid dehydrogenase subunit E2 [Gemmatimonadota bacterium]